MEKVAGRELTEEEAFIFVRDQWGRVFSRIVEDAPEVTGRYPIVYIERSDLEGDGYDTKNVTHETMQKIASDMCDAYHDNKYWQDVADVCGELEIPRKN